MSSSTQKKIVAIRTCRDEMTSFNGYVWPRKGRAECRDWDPEPNYGNGLHALRDGQGNGSLLNWTDNAVWMVLTRDDDGQTVVVGGKVKAPWWDVEFSGSRRDAIEYAASHYGLDPAKCAGGWDSASGDGSKAAAEGYRSAAASAGEGSTSAAVGGRSTASSAGARSAASSEGYQSEASSSGYCSAATSSGEEATSAAAGGRSTASSEGDGSKAAAAGDRSSASSGENGLAAVAGIGGLVRGGLGSALAIGYIDRWGRRRFATALVGEDGIEPDQWYRVTDRGKFVAAVVRDPKKYGIRSVGLPKISRSQT